MISLTIFNKLRGVKQIHELLTYKRIYYIYKLLSLTKSQRKTFHIGYKLTKIQTHLNRLHLVQKNYQTTYTSHDYID